MVWGSRLWGLEPAFLGLNPGNVALWLGDLGQAT